ncbi:MAG: hypothetical protein ACKOF9_04270 [Burkholderiales bacterium]
MARWASAAFLDGGLDYLAANATRMLLVSNYTAGDSYATVLANSVAEATMAPGDYTKSSSGLNRLVTTAAGKSATASAGTGATPDSHIAFTNGSNAVIYVTDETTNQVVIVGNTVNFPQLTYRSDQPVAP